MSVTCPTPLLTPDELFEFLINSKLKGCLEIIRSNSTFQKESTAQADYMGCPDMLLFILTVKIGPSSL